MRATILAGHLNGNTISVAEVLQEILESRYRQLSAEAEQPLDQIQPTRSGAAPAGAGEVYLEPPGPSAVEGTRGGLHEVRGEGKTHRLSRQAEPGRGAEQTLGNADHGKEAVCIIERHRCLPLGKGR